jgi:hypothetical protein
MRKTSVLPSTALGETRQAEPRPARGKPPESSPQASSPGASRGSIDALVQGSLVDLFQAYGVAVAPLPRSSRGYALKLPDVSTAIGFTTNTGLRKPGRLTLSMPSTVLGLMKVDGPVAIRQGDWARELANQLMGRIKNRMLQFNIRLQAGLPSTLDPKLLEKQLQNPIAMRAYAGRTLRGEVVVTIEGMPNDSELVYVGPAVVASEGDAILF